MKYTKHVYIIFMIFAMLGAAVPVRAVEKEYPTLKLVQTYASEEEVQTAYPELFASQRITDEGNTIHFYQPQTRSIVKQLQKRSPEVLREEQTDRDTIIWEKSYTYQISEDQAFLLETEWDGGRLKSGKADPAELRRKPIKRVLYNDSGEKITQLNPYVNIVSLSPDKQHFLAMGADEEVYPFVYLYLIDGKLLKSFEFEGGGSASFNGNGEFFKARSQKRFFIFSKSGEQIYETDYSTLKQ